MRISDWSSDGWSSELGVGRIAAVAPEGDSQGVEIEAGAELAPFLAPKGSIAVDGVSLTVNTLDDLPGGGVRFGINVIPHTAQVTSFEPLERSEEHTYELQSLMRISYAGFCLKNNTSK